MEQIILDVIQCQLFLNDHNDECQVEQEQMDYVHEDVDQEKQQMVENEKQMECSYLENLLD
jgi:hypothetical protein